MIAQKLAIGQVRKLKVEKADQVHNLEDVAMDHRIDLNLEHKSCDVAMKVCQCGETMKDQGVLGSKCIVAIVAKVGNLVLEKIGVIVVVDVVAATK